MTDQRFSLRPFTYSIAALMVLLVVLGAVYIRGTATTQWLTHTLRVKNDIQQLVGALQNSDTGYRGYLLTGNTTYLQPYNRGRNAYGAISSRLDSLVRDNPLQVQQLRLVDSLAAHKFAEMAGAIALAEAGQRATAVTSIQENSGKHYMDELRRVIDEMDAEETQLLVTRQKEHSFWRNLTFGILFLTILNVLYSMYRLYNRVKPLIEELVEAKTMLNNVNVNLSESLYKLKKALHEKDEATAARELALTAEAKAHQAKQAAVDAEAEAVRAREALAERNADLHQKLQVETERNYELTRLTAVELADTAKALDEELQRLYAGGRKDAPNSHALDLARELIVGVKKIIE